ncbi:MAG: hypothetical protein AAF871_03925 [Pseudomonadota bacterium]
MSNAPLIDARDARRLCISLIADFQSELLRKNRMRRSGHIMSVLGSNEDGSEGDVEISENELDIDSLRLMDLVLCFNDYFGLSATGIEDHLFINRSLNEWARLVSMHFERIVGGAKISFSTSGTVGEKKKISHERRDLDAEIDAICDALPSIKGSNRVLTAVAPHHMYGFVWSVLLPKRLGIDVLDQHFVAPNSISRMCSNGDIVLATPYLWRKYSEFGLRFPDRTIGVSSGGPACSSTWHAANATGVAELFDIYGSTETGGVGWRNSSKSTFNLFSNITQTDLKLCRQHGRKTCNAEDKLDWVNSRSFSVVGRRDRVIQIAGSNVDLGIVEDALRVDKEVEDVIARRDGMRLKVFIVSKTDYTNDLEDRLRRTALKLPATARPEAFTFGKSAPTTSLGKLQDW